MSVFELIWVKMIRQTALSVFLTLSAGSMVSAQSSDVDSTPAFDPALVKAMETPPEVNELLSDFFIQASNLVGSGNSRQATRLFHIGVLEILAQHAIELDPNSLPAWQLYLQTLGLMDPDDDLVDAEKLRAFEAISRLDPDDEVTRLQRLLFLIGEKQTQEARVRAYQVLLEPSSITLIGNEVAARLALKLAKLLYRTGDTEGYLEYLAFAIELDPYFPDATSEFAGYIDSSDPEAKVELLIAALIANPLDAIFAAQIGALALDAGDFSGAARMIGLARSSVQSRGMDLSEYALLQARALWGAGRIEESERVLGQLSLWLKKQAQLKAKADDPTLSDAELQELTVPVDPSMALLQSVMFMESDDQQKHRTFVDDTLVAYVLSLESQPVDPLDDPQAALARSEELTEMIAFAAWQGEDAEFMTLLIDELSRFIEPTVSQSSTFESWKEFAGGNYAGALQTLGSITEDDQDVLALLCLSLANERLGNMKSAARIWLRIVDDSPGSLVGIWARNRLESVLKTKIPRSEAADRLSFAIAQIPSAVDRILLNRERAYSMLIEPVADPIGPFVPLRYRLTLRNRSGIPLSIGPRGSLSGQVAFLPNYTVVGMQGGIAANNFVESINRRFSINPSEVLEFDVNLSISQLGRALSPAVMMGSTVGLRVISNFDFNLQASKVVPGVFSNVATSSLLRVDGVPIGKPWRRDALASARRMDGFQSLKDLALLLCAARGSIDDEDADLPEMVKFRDQVLDLYTNVYSNADEPVRAWLASVLPGGLDFGEFDIINTLVVLDDAPLVVAVTLINKVWGVNDEREAKSYISSTIGKRTGRVRKLAEGLTDIIATDESMNNRDQ